MRYERELRLEVTGDDVRALHAVLVLLELQVPHAERHECRFGEGTHEAVCRLQERCRIAATGVVDEATSDAIARTVDASTYTVDGTITSRDRAVGGLRVQIVDKDLTRLVPLAQAVTGDDGRYRVQFSARSLAVHCKGLPDLQALVHAGRSLVASSKVHYNASRRETIDVALPANASALPSEYEALTAALAAHRAGRLGELQESDERSDLTFLANKTGWDARLIAMAAIADRLSREVSPSIGPALYYALFRAGLPTEPARLYQVDAGVVGELWTQAIARGVIPSVLQATIPAAAEAFRSLVAGRVLDAPVSTSVSTIAELARVALGDDEPTNRRFAEIYTRHRADRPAFWTAIRETFGPELASRLQLDGNLGELTQDNAPLIARLHRAEARPLTSMTELASRGYYNPTKWTTLLDETPIPETIAGDTIETRRANYAGLLASQVKLRFPTAVMAAQIGAGEVPLASRASHVREAVHGFLAAHQDTFEIGKQPIEQYLVRNNLRGQVDPSVTDEIKRVQRVYQITPNDDAMVGLLGKNIHSAYQIARLDEAEFVRGLSGELGGEAKAREVWARARQVHNSVLNVANHYLLARTAPQIGVHSPGQIVNQTPGGSGNAPDIVAYPTLENLFGSMDYCACDHCRSILSPAAYLVDLLHFIDRKPPPNDPSTNPQSVLFERRPDIQYLKLTCENTNTPLPYVDIVNETLEYFVANASKHNSLSLANYTGHDIDHGARSEELLASPQYVDDTAYDAVRTAVFPTPLPFNKPLETLRRYFGKLGVSLAAAMETLRDGDAFDRASVGAYGWRDILMERLGLSREEYGLLTDRSVTVRRLYGYSDTDLDASVPAELAKLETFCRRVGVSYAELAELLQTRFINPSRTLIARAELLGVPFSTLHDLRFGALTAAKLGKLLPRKLDPALYGGDPTLVAADGSNYDAVLGQVIATWLATNQTYERLIGLVTISNPVNSLDLCAVGSLELRYADPDPGANQLGAIDFIRLIRFIRLWRKLGWTIDQTDAAVEALYPTPPQGTTELERLDAGFVTLLARLGVVRGVIDSLGIDLDNELRPLLTCWSPIAAPLYRSMFLGSTVRRPDPVFADNGFGDVLVQDKTYVHDHREALRAAFGLTGDEIALIVAELVQNANHANPPPTTLLTQETLPLTLANISAIYRRGWLARKLRLSVLELLLIEDHAGIDPFAPPDPVDPPIVKLVELVDALRGGSLRPTQALYLIWNQDLSGKSAPEDRQILELASALRSDFAAVERDFTIVDDPSGEIARARMALVYGAEATDFFFGLLNNTISVSAKYVHPPAAAPQPLLVAAKGRLGYDDLTKRFTFSGYLDPTLEAALAAAAGGDVDLQQAVTDLDTAHRQLVDPFFTRYPELKPLLITYISAPPTDPPETRRTALLASILPELERRRKRAQALAAVSGRARADLGYADAILDDATVLEAANTAAIALDDFTALESSPGATIAGAWDGHVDAAETGTYAFEVVATAGVTGVTLTIDGTDALMASTTPNTWTNGAAIALTAGRLVPFTLAIAGAGTVTVRWMTKGHGWEVIPSDRLFATAIIEPLRTTYTRFLKAHALATALKLTPNEVAYFAARVDFGIAAKPWLNALAVTTDPSSTVAVALRGRLLALLDFARLKQALSPTDERLLAVFHDPAAKLPDGESLLLTLANWDRDSLTAILARFGVTVAALDRVETFRRIHDAFLLAGKLGISAAALIDATTNHPDPIGASTSHVIRDFESALRARYDATTWLEVIQPINDELRTLRRDALVAYILQRFRNDPTSTIDTPDKLFEYFLMDVEMDSCMQTSRIRHALSSVQLFIERCFMNLEKRVAPSLLPAKEWEWRRRYRVWEANRKVFLWPENWLEPELRDHQSSIFKETMSELLQSDITESTAAVAMQNYLMKLEELAKLEPCGMYVDGSDVHVVARTSGAQRKYFYRCKDDGSWLPWEQIKLEIEDNPIIPVVWNGRLLLFWLKLITKGQETSNVPTPDSGALADLTTADFAASPRVTVHAVLCWSEYLNGKWQPAKTSDVRRPAQFVHSIPGIPKQYASSDFERGAFRMGTVHEGDALRILIAKPQLHDEGMQWTSFLFYNTHGEPSPDLEAPAPPTLDVTNSRLLSVEHDSSGGLANLFKVRFFDADGPSTQTVLKSLSPSRAYAVEPWQGLHDWDAPFFFQDSRHVFYVTPESSSVEITDPSSTPFGPSIIKWKHLRHTDVPPLIYRPLGDPVRLRERATEDAYITHALAAPGTIRYGDVAIGIGGAIAAPTDIIR